MLYYLNGGRGGVATPGSLAVSQHAGTPAMNVDVAEGAALILGTEATYQGSYFVEAQAVTTLTISANASGNPRLDLVVAKVQDAQYSGATNSWSLAVVTGTAAATPRYPTVPANAIVLATVAVASGATSIVNANITDIRTSSATDGLTTLSNKGLVAATGALVACTSAQRPTGVSGLQIYETDTRKVYIYDGSTWQYLRHTGDGVWTSFAATTAGIGSPSVTSDYMTMDGSVTARYQVTLAGAGSATAVLLGLPVTAYSGVRGTNAHGTAFAHDASANADAVAQAKIEAGGTTLSFWSASSTGAPAASSFWLGSSVPMVWAASDTIECTVTYRVS